MTARQFFDLVVRLRACQKEYFRTRDKTVLSQAKELEKEVDAEIDRVYKLISIKNNENKV